MRTLGWSLASLLAAAPLLAQQPAAKQAPPIAPAAPPVAAPRNVNFDPDRDPLDKLLLQWEQKMKSLRSLATPVVKTETDKVAGTKTVYEGSVRLLRPDMADLYLAKKNAPPNTYERFLATRNYLYEYRPQQKLIRVHQLPQRAPGQPAVEDGFLSFLFGIEAKELKKRYDMTLMRQDQWYGYVHVKPVAAADKAEFSEARLAILLTTMLPAEMIFVPPGGDEVHWKLGPVDTAKQLVPADFAPPTKLPPDWQMQQVPAARVAAPAGQPAPGPAAMPPPNKVRQVGP